MGKTEVITSNGTSISIGIDFNEFAEKYFDEEYRFKSNVISFKDSQGRRTLIFTNQIVSVFEEK